jgi:hypothetical protein
LLVSSRHDFIEVALEDMDYPALLLYFIAYKDLQFAVVRYYQPWRPLDSNLDVYVCTGLPEVFVQEEE